MDPFVGLSNIYTSTFQSKYQSNYTPDYINSRLSISTVDIFAVFNEWVTSSAFLPITIFWGKEAVHRLILESISKTISVNNQKEQNNTLMKKIQTD